MHFSMWAYPWDVNDKGIEVTTHDFLNRACVNTISIATSYHAGRFLQPQSPNRKSYYPEDGTIYFLPNEELWCGKEMQPLVAKEIAENGDVLLALIASKEKTQLNVSCWTVCLHNTRLGMAHPKHVTRNAFGNPNHYSLCPSSPVVRDYVATLVQDMTSHYQPDMVELESPGFMGFGHGFHHEKDGVGLNQEDDFLLSLCFCEHCVARAKNAGVDAQQAQETVKTLINDFCEREIPEKQFRDFPDRKTNAFDSYPELRAFLDVRPETVSSLVKEIRDVAHPDTKVVVIDLADAWLGGFDIAAGTQACDGMILCCYDMSPSEIRVQVAAVRKQMGSDKFLGVGLTAFYPEVTSGIELAAKTAAAIEAGATGINIYNYGLIPEKRLDWIRQAALGH